MVKSAAAILDPMVTVSLSSPSKMVAQTVSLPLSLDPLKVAPMRNYFYRHGQQAKQARSSKVFFASLPLVSKSFS
jgi:hypothetical protein